MLACFELLERRQGCDASVLLAGTEQNAPPNQSLNPKGFNVIDNIKTQVEAVCKQTVSCADILAVATRDSVIAVIIKTAIIRLLLVSSSIRCASTSLTFVLIACFTAGCAVVDCSSGRRDSTMSASSSMVLNDLLPPSYSLAQLISRYNNKGLDATDMVALSGLIIISET
jgi:peroxidase